MDNRRRKLEFEVGDNVFFKVSLTKGVMRFGILGKLNPRFVGPFEILEKLKDVACRLTLPPALSELHNVFHMLMLRKYISDPNHMIEVALLQLREDLSYDEKPMKIVDYKEQVLRRRIILYVKVQWQNHSEKEATWELKSEIKEK